MNYECRLTAKSDPYLKKGAGYDKFWSVMSKVLKDYRAIMRHIKRLPSGEGMKQHVTALYRAGKSLSKGDARTARETAHAYATTVSSVHELSFLRGLDTGDKMEQDELVSAMANRVGLNMPSQFDDGKAY